MDRRREYGSGGRGRPGCHEIGWLAAEASATDRLWPVADIPLHHPYRLRPRLFLALCDLAFRRTCSGSTRHNHRSGSRSRPEPNKPTRLPRAALAVAKNPRAGVTRIGIERIGDE